MGIQEEPPIEAAVVSYAKGLHEVTEGDLALAGGKAVGLGRLFALGLPVPPGFVLTTMGYDEFVASAGLAPLCARLLAALADGRDDEADEAGRVVRSRFQEAPLPAGLRAAIASGYAALGHRAAVAVRSSATIEDLAEASFAGQQETRLNVREAHAVVRAVREVWAGLFAARALAYRRHRGEPGEVGKVAVVVQRMVAPRVSGVLFTRDPADPATDTMLVEANWGLGESVVSGLVTPDHYEMDGASLAVKTMRVARKQLQVELAEGGPRQVEVPPPLQEIPCLDAAQLRRLCETGKRIEEGFGRPQDVEWAFDGEGALQVLQARPITALRSPGRPAGGPSPEEPRTPALYQQIYRDFLRNL